MKTKKLLAWLLVLLLLAALFSACANDTGKTDDQGSGGKTDDQDKTNGQDKPDEGDAPVEVEMKTITWFGADSHQWEYTMV